LILFFRPSRQAAVFPYPPPYSLLITSGQQRSRADHNLRHSLSNWLVNKAKVEPKTVQGILRHSKIQTTLDLYTQEDSDEARGAQGTFMKAVGIHAGMVQ